MHVTITQRDVDEALRLSPRAGNLHFFHNPIALAYSREMIVDYCAVTIEKVHCSSPSGLDFVQPLLPVARAYLTDWMRYRTMRLGLLQVF